ncbi:hypothetical protein GCM10023187_52670 [Nibrella viscosa]|uniref:Caspase family p20 domain-containing protein n=1 Tax=Nibrella viscosa TaxID=1084524 RepID=A0ABP8KYH6_9BACT
MGLLVATTGMAQKSIKIVGGTAPAGTERRAAIIIANQDYQQDMMDLKKVYNDADDMKEALDKLGFEIFELRRDLDRRSLDRLLAGLPQRLKGYQVALFYYSGHGAEYQGDNYLLPTDMPPLEYRSDVATYGLSLKRVYQAFADGGIRTSIVISDACRNLPLGRSTGLPTGLTLPANNPAGTFTMFATRSGNLSLENVKGRNGYFTQELLKNIVQPNWTLDKIFYETRKGVKAATGNQQDPSMANELDDQFVFVLKPEDRPLSTPVLNPTTSQVAESTPSRPTTTTNWSSKYLDLPFADLEYVPGGTFQMGDTRGEGDSNERPVHTVTVSSFLMGKYEVTQRQWEAVMGSNPSEHKECPDCPVENVSWEDVKVFLQKLNARASGSLHYRLPTEAEWEYAAGGGAIAKRSRFGNGEDILNPAGANFYGITADKKAYSVAGEYRGKTVRVGSFSPNGLGLHDLSGNVWEWCADWYGPYTQEAQTDPSGPSSGWTRVLRGGSWYFNSAYCRVAHRNPDIPSLRNNYVGFRLVAQSR